MGSSSAKTYINTVVGRGRSALPPTDHQPDWNHVPNEDRTEITSAPIELPRTAGQHASYLDRLGSVLFNSYGRTGKRLSVTAKEDTYLTQGFMAPLWARGAASGGSLYPARAYWVEPGSYELRPGVYYYCTSTHSLKIIRATDGIPDALAGNIGPTPGIFGYLIISTRIWRSSFKYGSFSYHVVTTDHGCFLETIEGLIGAPFESLSTCLDFDPVEIARLLGVNPYEEQPLSVLVVHGRPARETHDDGSMTQSVDATTLHPRAVSDRKTLGDQQQQSPTRHRIFPMVHQAQAELFESTNAAGLKPTYLTSARTSAELDRHIELLRKRRSSFGLFDGSFVHRSCIVEILDELRTYTLKRLEDFRLPGLDPQFLLASTRITDLDAGWYKFEGSGLATLGQYDAAAVMQSYMLLNNYSTIASAATVIPCLNYDQAISTHGPVGLVKSNAVLGALTQKFYTASASRNLGAGAVFGFDNSAILAKFKSVLRGAVPAICLMGGTVPTHYAEYDFRNFERQGESE